MNQSILFLRAEGLVIAALSLGLYLQQGFAWYWLPVAFLLFDLSMVGYLFNNHIGAVLYNWGHSLLMPCLLLLINYYFDSRILSFFILVWFFHIGVDRALGFGLKLFKGFKHTHLGTF